MKLRGWIIAGGMIIAACTAWAVDLQLSESTIDYGTIPEGPPVIKKVILSNGGSQTLTIANVTTS